MADNLNIDHEVQQFVDDQLIELAARGISADALAAPLLMRAGILAAACIGLDAAAANFEMMARELRHLSGVAGRA